MITTDQRIIESVRQVKALAGKLRDAPTAQERYDISVDLKEASSRLATMSVQNTSREEEKAS